MNATQLQSRLAQAAGELAREAGCWRGKTRDQLRRDAQQTMRASTLVHQARARDRRAFEALLESALESVIRHAMARLDLELESTR